MSEKILLATSDSSVSSKVSEVRAWEGSLLVAPTFRIALAELRNSAFHLIMIDSALDGGDGISLGPVALSRQPASRVILLSRHTKWALDEASLKLGFHAVIDISRTADEILLASKTAVDRKSLAEDSLLTQLSLREREILSSIADGLRNSEIAELHRISNATIKSHLTSIYRKLGVRNRVEASAMLRR